MFRSSVLKSETVLWVKCGMTGEHMNIPREPAFSPPILGEQVSEGERERGRGEADRDIE